MQTLGRHRFAFTLVELLVVVTIVSILMAMLLPVAANGLRAARTVGCASNLRQIYLPIQDYANEANDTFPQEVYQTNSGNPARLVAERLRIMTTRIGYSPLACPADGGYPPDRRYPSLWGHPINYDLWSKSWTASEPEERRRLMCSYTGSDNTGNSGYLTERQGVFARYPDTGGPYSWTHLRQVRNPTKVLMFADGSSRACDFYGQSFRIWHPNALNMVFLDGHGESYKCCYPTGTDVAATPLQKLFGRGFPWKWEQ